MTRGNLWYWVSFSACFCAFISFVYNYKTKKYIETYQNQKIKIKYKVRRQ